MADVTPEDLAAQIEQLLRELVEMHGELADMRAVQIKDILGRIDGHVRKMEKEKGQRGGAAR
jgi:predicted component of type VI protein secretion system